MGWKELNEATAAILAELFNFDGQIEDLCSMSEIEGQFGMPAEKMLSTLRSFIAANQPED